ncbi:MULTISPECIES: hypothetical protein [Vibrio]|uniref:hypothetical protein n=1 Tax=Vibrio TaxID=662 RepID=UPI0000D54507|nr:MULTISPECIES: hypothetical protein [Vibrio]EAS76982.1 hypothetical protein V12G01_17087 [Vibrio alginolyticus 12G01]ELB2770423.1 hypothetical protein [Vibrio alginolyticus]MBT0068948.1 hypothetical protein [Vibrio alginolyticus]MCR9439534.1 hypothetical protein [Vibrio alginolyticus]MCS0107399.1 hypothetical protein [Vibrio alginolyticus]
MLGWLFFFLSCVVSFVSGFKFLLPVMESSPYKAFMSLYNEDAFEVFLPDIQWYFMSKMLSSMQLVIMVWGIQFFIISYLNVEKDLVNRHSKKLSYFKSAIVIQSSVMGSFILGGVCDAISRSGGVLMWWDSIAISVLLIALPILFKYRDIFKLGYRKGSFQDKHKTTITWCLLSLAASLWLYVQFVHDFIELYAMYQSVS